MRKEFTLAATALCLAGCTGRDTDLTLHSNPPDPHSAVGLSPNGNDTLVLVQNRLGSYSAVLQPDSNGYMLVIPKTPLPSRCNDQPEQKGCEARGGSWRAHIPKLRDPQTGRLLTLAEQGRFVTCVDIGTLEQIRGAGGNTDDLTYSDPVTVMDLTGPCTPAPR